MAPLRWLGVASWVVILFDSRGASPGWAQAALVGLGVFHAAVVSIWLRREHVLRALPLVTSIADLGFAATLCALTGGFGSIAFPYLYLTILGTSLRFGFAGGLVTAALVALISSAFFFRETLGTSPFDLGFRIFFGFCVALLSALLAREHARRTAHLAGERDDANLLIQANRAISSTLDPQQLLEQALESIIRAVPCRGGVLASLAADHGSIVHAAAAGCLQLPDDSASLEWLLSAPSMDDSATPQLLFPLGPPPFLQACGAESMISIPLRRQATDGVLVLADRIRDGRATHFSGRDFDLVKAIADEATLALDGAQLFQEMSESRVRQRDLLRRVINAQEEERKRVVGEIHDVLGGQIVAALHRLRQFRAKGGLSDGSQAQLREVEEQIASTTESVRELMEEIRPSVLDELSLRDAVVSLIAEVRPEAPFPVDLSVPRDLPALEPSTSLALFRILQEAIRNAVLHAGNARLVQVRLCSEESKELSMTISDDGSGFDPERQQGKRFGLLYMRERAEACGGVMSIETAPGCGTTISVTVPTRGSNV